MPNSVKSEAVVYHNGRLQNLRNQWIFGFQCYSMSLFYCSVNQQSFGWLNTSDKLITTTTHSQLVT